MGLELGLRFSVSALGLSRVETVRRLDFGRDSWGQRSTGHHGEALGPLPGFKLQPRPARAPATASGAWPGASSPSAASGGPVNPAHPYPETEEQGVASVSRVRKAEGPGCLSTGGAEAIRSQSGQQAGSGQRQAQAGGSPTGTWWDMDRQLQGH